MVASFDARPSGTVIAKRAWHSAWDASAAMPVLFLGTMALGAALGALLFVAAPLATAMAVPKVEELGLGPLAAHIAVHALSILLWSALTAPVAVAVHRFILLDETAPGSLSYAPHHTRLFFFWAASLQLAFFVARTAPLALSAVMFVRGMVAAVVVIATVILAIQLALIFPAIAIDAPSASAEQRIDTSFRQMEGNFWLFVRAAILAFLPLLILTFLALVLAAGGHMAALKTMAQPHNQAGLALGLVSGICNIIGVAVAAAMASWMYAWARPSITDRL